MVVVIVEPALADGHHLRLASLQQWNDGVHTVFGIVRMQTDRGPHAVVRRRCLHGRRRLFCVCAHSDKPRHAGRTSVLYNLHADALIGHMTVTVSPHTIPSTPFFSEMRALCARISEKNAWAEAQACLRGKSGSPFSTVKSPGY